MGWLGWVLLAGCVLSPQQRADTLAGQSGLQRRILSAGIFQLTAYVRVADPTQPLHIYIEGDGRAWRTPTEASSDPTPRHMSGLQLAAADPGPNVGYLARPCQFTRADPSCDVRYWTGRRYALEVVTSVNDAITTLEAATAHQPVDLVGYSGGGALAVLVAARRQDVHSLRTVAANLDVEAVNTLHHVSAMPESLNPIDFGAAVRAIPQIHFSGARDTVVPPEIARRFGEAVGGSCALIQSVAGMTHDGDWARLWPGLLQQTPHC
jgi:pimeloyl-ACP methyl ester carboxylesterase